VGEDGERELLVTPDDEVPIVQELPCVVPPSGDEREGESTAADERVGFLVLRRHLPRREAPVPSALADTLEVDLEAPSRIRDPRRAERVGEHPDRQIVRLVHGPVLGVLLQRRALADVLAVEPPLDRPGLDQVAHADRAGHPVDAGRAPLVFGQTRAELEERIGAVAPVRDELAGRGLLADLHRPLVETVHPQVAVVGFAERIELGGRFAGHELSGGRLLRGEVGHEVPVAPSGADAVAVPGLRRRVLDRPAEAVSLGMRDREHLVPVQGHGGAGSPSARQPFGATAADCTLARCASSWRRTSSGEP
jgi:hypothetical protein